MNGFMKRIGLVVAVIVVSLGQLCAGNDIFRLGITAGGNITKVRGSGEGFLHSGWRYDSSGGYFVGMAARVSIPILNFGLDASLVYSQEMADLESGNARLMDKLRYFSVPVHVRYDFELPMISELVAPYVFAGPQCNFALNEFDFYELFRQDPETARRFSEYDWEELTNSRVWKFDLGFGIIVASHVQVSYFYAIPLESTFRFKTLYDDSRTHFRTGTHRIGLTYYF